MAAPNGYASESPCGEGQKREVEVLQGGGGEGGFRPVASASGVDMGDSGTHGQPGGPRAIEQETSGAERASSGKARGRGGL
eukprot:3665700-Pyramimonas_sp.AAC.1